MKHKWRKDRDGEIDMWAWESDFNSGPVCEVCGRSVCEYCAPDWMNLDDCPGPHIITNADYIRAMSDEELAEEMSNRDCPGCPLIDTCTSLTGCRERLLKWLQRPHEGGRK